MDRARLPGWMVHGDEREVGGSYTPSGALAPVESVYCQALSDSGVLVQVAAELTCPSKAEAATLARALGAELATRLGAGTSSTPATKKLPRPLRWPAGDGAALTLEVSAIEPHKVRLSLVAASGISG